MTVEGPHGSSAPAPVQLPTTGIPTPGNDKAPEVVVVCYTFQHERFIAECIESVLGQVTSFRFVLRVHDDSSSDFTWGIISRYAELFPLAVLASRSEARSFPRLPHIEEDIDTPFIAFIDGDDYWTDPKKLQKQWAYMNDRPHISMSYHDSVLVEDSRTVGLERAELLDKSEWSGDEMRRLASPPRSTIMLRRFTFARNRDFPILNFDELICVQASTHGGLGRVGSINPSVARVHGENAWRLMSPRNKRLNRAFSFAYISEWLMENGFPTDSASFLKKALLEVAALNPEMKRRLFESDYDVVKRWFRRNIRKFFSSNQGKN